MTGRIPQQWPNQRAAGCLHREGQPRQPLHHQRGAHCAEFRIKRYVKEAALCHRPVQIRTGCSQRRVMDRRSLIRFSETIERIENRALIVGQIEFHQRDLGRPSTSLAIILS